MQENKYLIRLKNLVLSSLSGEKVKVILFGSRARGDSQKTSDVDIGVMPYGKFDEKRMVLLKEKIEDLNIPYKVEIVDFSHVSGNFKKEALKGAVIWKDGN